MALYQIAQDVGADRAFLFSESGFQAGAIAAARNTNVTLTSLGAVRESAGEDIINSALVALNRRLTDLDNWARRITGYPDFPLNPKDAYFEETLATFGILLFLRLALQKALARDFPIIFPAVGTYGPVTSPDAESFLRQADQAITTLSEMVGGLERMAEEAERAARSGVEGLTTAVALLLEAGEAALFSGEEWENGGEERRLRALEGMREVGRVADELRKKARGPLRSALGSLMETLIDGVYLDLTKQSVPPSRWDRSKADAKTRLVRLKSVAGLA